MGRRAIAPWPSRPVAEVAVPDPAEAAPPLTAGTDVVGVLGEAGASSLSSRGVSAVTGADVFRAPVSATSPSGVAAAALALDTERPASIPGGAMSTFGSPTRATGPAGPATGSMTGTGFSAAASVTGVAASVIGVAVSPAVSVIGVVVGTTVSVIGLVVPATASVTGLVVAATALVIGLVVETTALVTGLAASASGAVVLATALVTGAAASASGLAVSATASVTGLVVAATVLVTGAVASVTGAATLATADAAGLVASATGLVVSATALVTGAAVSATACAAGAAACPTAPASGAVTSPRVEARASPVVAQSSATTVKHKGASRRAIAVSPNRRRSPRAHSRRVGTASRRVAYGSDPEPRALRKRALAARVDRSLVVAAQRKVTGASVPTLGARPLGYALTGKSPLKTRYLAENPHMACSFWSPSHDTVFIDAVATWVTDAEELADTWALFRDTPQPLGWGQEGLDGYGPEEWRAEIYTPLRLDPWRVQIMRGAEYPVGNLTGQVWRS